MWVRILSGPPFMVIKMEFELLNKLLKKSVKHELNGIQMKILIQLALNPATATELSNSLNRSKTTIYNWLTCLDFYGLIRKNIQRPNIYYLAI